MFEQDYVMRMIEETARGLMKLVFGIDTVSSLTELLPQVEDRGSTLSLFDMVDTGRINEAENLLFDLAEDGDRETYKTALMFYAYLNGKTDSFLLLNDFSREEIASGLRDITRKYGIEGFDTIIR